MNAHGCIDSLDYGSRPQIISNRRRWKWIYMIARMAAQTWSGPRSHYIGNYLDTWMQQTADMITEVTNKTIAGLDEVSTRRVVKSILKWTEQQIRTVCNKNMYLNFNSIYLIELTHKRALECTFSKELISSEINIKGTVLTYSTFGVKLGGWSSMNLRNCWCEGLIMSSRSFSELLYETAPCIARDVLQQIILPTSLKNFMKYCTTEEAMTPDIAFKWT